MIGIEDIFHNFNFDMENSAREVLINSSSENSLL